MLVFDLHAAWHQVHKRVKGPKHHAALTGMADHSICRVDQPRKVVGVLHDLHFYLPRTIVSSPDESSVPLGIHFEIPYRSMAEKVRRAVLNNNACDA